MGKKGSEPEGAEAAQVRWQEEKTWTNFLNLWVERNRDWGSKSPKVSGKIFALGLIAVAALSLLFTLAWVGIIPNFKT